MTRLTYESPSYVCFGRLPIPDAQARLLRRKDAENNTTVLNAANFSAASSWRVRLCKQARCSRKTPKALEDAHSDEPIAKFISVMADVQVA